MRRAARARLLAGFVLAALISTVLAVVAPPPASAEQLTVAVVTRRIPVPGADEPLIEHLTESGWNVVVVDDDDVYDNGRTSVKGADLVVISSSVYPAKIKGKLKPTAKPVMVMEPTLYDDFGFTSRDTATHGETESGRKVTIVDPTSPLLGGLTGTPTIASKPKPLNFGQVGGDAHIAAVDPNDGDKAVVFSFDTGDALARRGDATGRRVGLHMSQTLPRLSNRDGWRIFDAAAAWATGIEAPPVEVTAYESIEPATGTHLGANISKGPHPNRFTAVAAFEDTIGRDITIINRFQEFSAGLTSSFYWERRHIEVGRTLMISWRATDNANSTTGEPDPNRAKKIVRGEYDEQIDAMAIALRDLDAPLLLRFNWEMDQDVGAPQNIGTPAEFIAAWRYVHGRFADLDVQNVEWVWAPRAASFNKDVGPTYYPGDRYVDWIGGSAVPLRSYRDPQIVYGAWNEWASNRNVPKPQLLWNGLRENPDDPQWKAGFINELHDLIVGPWDGVKALVYYHAASPTAVPYWIDSSSQALNQFLQLACDSHFETTDSC